MVNKTAMEGLSVFWHCSIREPWLVSTGRVLIRWTKDDKPIGSLEIGLRAHIDVRI